VEYICALCSEAYSSTCDYNPWWALASHECPKCRKSQVSIVIIILLLYFEKLLSPISHSWLYFHCRSLALISRLHPTLSNTTRLCWHMRKKALEAAVPWVPHHHRVCCTT
jgi:hypothetical protein